MENKELQFNLIKKIESEEMRVETDSNGDIGLVAPIQVPSLPPIPNQIWIGKVNLDTNKKGEFVGQTTHPQNDKFKERFYKEKGLDKCGYKDCRNNIFKTQHLSIGSQVGQGTKLKQCLVAESDYKAVNIPCQDKHKRYICLECYESKYRKLMGFDLKMEK